MHRSPNYDTIWIHLVRQKVSWRSLITIVEFYVEMYLFNRLNYWLHHKLRKRKRRIYWGYIEKNLVKQIKKE